MSNLEEPPYKKSKDNKAWVPNDAISVLSPRVIALQRKTSSFKSCKEELSPLSSLPYDVALYCLARVTRSDHAALSTLSKTYRSLVTSSELYKMRSLMSRTETEFYVCLRTPYPRWYVLRSRTLTPIFSLPSQSPEGSSVVTLDSMIYVIGGLIKGNPISDVFICDIRTHTWRRVPSMRMPRASPAAAVVDGKIYVLGGCECDNSLNSGEVYDPKTKTWELLPPMPFLEKRHEYIHGCVVRDKKIYVVDVSEGTTYYSVSEGNWGKGNLGVLTGGRRDWCMIDNLLFCLSNHGKIFWCKQEELDWREPEGMRWSKEVKGLEALSGNLSRSRLVHFGPKLVDIYYQAKYEHNNEVDELAVLLPGARLSNSNGNIVLFWDEMVGIHIQQIWCAEISLERRQGDNIWGNIEWSNVVMTVDHNDIDPFLDRYKVLHYVSFSL